MVTPKFAMIENEVSNLRKSEFIMIAQSKGVNHLSPNTFCHVKDDAYQQRDIYGALYPKDIPGDFHLLINMIAEILQHDDRSILKMLRAKAAVYVRSFFTSNQPRN
jgi:hypothetical protein